MAWNDANKDIDDEKMSKINSAGIINITLENLWRDCYTAMSRGDLTLRNTKLDAVWAILGGEVERDSDEDKAINELDLKIYNEGELKSKVGKGFNVKANPNNAIQYQLLKNKSLYLRRLQNSQGKGTSYINNDDYDFD